METPGVSVSPIQLISGSSPFCETLFEDVRVPKKNVVHKVNERLDGGEGAARPRAQHDRRAPSARAAAPAASAGTLARAARERYLGSENGGALADPVLRDQIAQIEMDTRAFALTVQRSRDAAQGRPPARARELDLQGLRHRAEPAPPRAAGAHRRAAGPRLGGRRLRRRGARRTTRDWLRSRGNTIEGGTSEVQRNIIAKRVLGLPD